MHHIGRSGAVSFLLGVVGTPQNMANVTRMCGGSVGNMCVSRGVAIRNSGIVVFMVEVSVRFIVCVGSDPVDLTSQDFTIVNRNSAPVLLGSLRDLVPCVVLEACSRIRGRSCIMRLGCDQG